MKFKVTLKERKRGQLKSEIRFITSSIQEFKINILDIGQKAEVKMKGIIDANRQRPVSPHDDTNARASRKSLIDTIKLDVFDSGDIFSWGLGNISELNQYSPHWAMINWGGLPPSTKDYPTLRGKFEPDGGGLFRKGKPYFPIYPTKPIRPLNYIETTTNMVRTSLEAFTNLFRR